MAGFTRTYWHRLFCSLLCCIAVASHAGETPAMRLPGKFVWAELVTDDLPASQRFYNGLLGWTFTTVDGYVTVYNGEEPVAGMFYRERPADPAARPRWIAYVSVEDIPSAVRRVEAAGGTVRLPASPMPGHGERVVFADAEGALFGTVHLTQGDPEDYLADTGSWIWLQLMSRDLQRAAGFYRTVGDYELVDGPAGDGMARFVLARDGYARAAILPLSPRRIEEGFQPMWLLFTRVDSVSDVVGKVRALGGKVVVPPRESLHDGRVALVEDPAGGMLGVMEWDAEPAGEEVAP